MTLCEDLLQTSELQFRFKKRVGCTDAIFALKATVGHFVNDGSCVYTASLDISKAFDRVNHFKLFRTLVNLSLIHISEPTRPY